jgi:hypothetical protein
MILTAVYGLFWLVFGLNGFFYFFAIPEPSKEGASFMQALSDTKYVMPIIYGSQILIGLMLLSRRFEALALILLAPIIANIMLYDFFLNPSGLLIGSLITVIYAILIFEHKQKFISLLKP